MVKKHNIMILVGNGFDISAINQYKLNNDHILTTSYSDFYNFIFNNDLIGSDNRIFSILTKKKKYGIENWSDFEVIIDEIINCHGIYQNLEYDLDEIRNNFVIFINNAVTNDILLWIDKESNNKELALQSVSKFLGDLTNNRFLAVSSG